ncbi:MAG: hypothetical protein WCE68_00450 [Anaerolineales bacterium]
MPLLNSALLVCLCLWMILETIQDLRDRNIPVWYSLSIIMFGLVWLLANKTPWAALLMGISIISTEIYPYGLKVGRWLGGAILLITAALTAVLYPVLLPLVVGWLILAVLWFLNILGGADALAATSLMLFFPSWGMAAAILVGMVCWSLFMLWLKYGKEMGLRLITVLQSKANGTRAAGLGAYAMAALFFGVYHWLVR